MSFIGITEKRNFCRKIDILFTHPIKHCTNIAAIGERGIDPF